MKGRIKKLRLQSKAVEAPRERTTQKIKEGENKRDNNKADFCRLYFSIIERSSMAISS